MKIFYDCEFFERGPTYPIQLISIGLVREDGEEYYAQAVEFSWSSVPAGSKSQGSPSTEDHWLRANVLPQLDQCSSGFDQNAHADRLYTGRCAVSLCPWRTRRELAKDIIAFVGTDKAELWGYYADYDHVVLCQIFGRMIDLPANWPIYTRDIKQYALAVGNPQLPKPPGEEHHARADAHWNKKAWEFLWAHDSRGLT